MIPSWGVVGGGGCKKRKNSIKTFRARLVNVYGVDFVQFSLILRRSMFGKEKKITTRKRDFLQFRFFGLLYLPSSDVVNPRALGKSGATMLRMVK